MRHFTVISLAAIIAACASVGEVVQRGVSPSQNYRFNGQDKIVTIDGNIEVTSSGAFSGNYNKLNVYFDSQKVITGNLAYDYSGEVAGTWKGKKLNASCTSKIRADQGYDVRCMIFVDNERTVTLTF